MQRIVGVFLILLGLGWLASQLPATPDTDVRRPRTTSWRRTCDGWERAAWLHGDVSRERPALHPAIVGLSLLLFALAALLGLSADPPRENFSGTVRSSIAPPESRPRIDPGNRE